MPHNFMEKLLTKRKRYAAMVATSERRVGFRQVFGGQKKEKNMSGTKAGGLKAAQTNREKYGKEFYSKIYRKRWSERSYSVVLPLIRLWPGLLVRRADVFLASCTSEENN